ncbi:MAG TPA: hypothetical protein VI197_22655 [Polyangiaceae bacterium]
MRPPLLTLLRRARWTTALVLLTACGGTLDAGSDARTDAALPMSADNPFIVNNDGPFDNWQGELMVLLAANGLELAGLIINDSGAWPDVDRNLSGWEAMLQAAEASGIDDLPAPTPSPGPPLVEPSSGEISDTEPNHSEGAELIVRAALDATNPPLVVVTGGRLTDVADAYLVEPAIADRVVVVASLGELTEQGANMGIPNGDMDPWATAIVAERLPYVQVSAYYDQLGDVPSARLPELPQNPLGDWIAEKRDRIFETPIASDQVAILTAAIPGFALRIDRSRHDGPAAANAGETPALTIDDAGSAWLVSKVDGELATQTFWNLLSEAF